MNFECVYLFILLPVNSIILCLIVHKTTGVFIESFVAESIWFYFNCSMFPIRNFHFWAHFCVGAQQFADWNTKKYIDFGETLQRKKETKYHPIFFLKLCCCWLCLWIVWISPVYLTMWIQFRFWCVCVILTFRILHIETDSYRGIDKKKKLNCSEHRKAHK